MLLALLLAPFGAAASPTISEFLARNDGSIRDEDGDRPDWIELRNTSSQAINLSGFSLTDDPAIPAKWVFPDRTLAGGSYLIVFASGKDRRDPPGELHSNFSLASDGGYLALFAPGGLDAESVFDPYPPQLRDVSFGEGASTETTTVVATGASCRWLVPTASVSSWTGLAFDDSSWTSANTGIAYERGGTDNYTALIGPNGDVGTQMYQRRTSAYIRIAFDLSNAQAVSGMTLRMKYDDGFAAFINGEAGPSARAPSPLGWNSSATTIHDDDDALVFENFVFPEIPGTLTNGENILAIQGLNRSTTSSDFLIVPELDVTTHTILPDSDGYHTTLTPGQANSASYPGGVVADTKFSVDRGFYSLAFPVAITTETAAAQIRYTTDGSPPTPTSGSIYLSPINISTTTVLRAAAFKDGFAPTNVDTQTYIFASSVRTQSGMDSSITGNPSYANLIDTALRGNLPVVSLVTSNSNLFGASGIYTNSNNAGRAAEVPISVEYFTPSRSEEFQIDAGVRIHGGNARSHPKKPLRLYFRREYGDAKLRYPLYPGSPVAEFDQLLLRAGGHDSWSLAATFGRANNDLPPHGTIMRDQFLRRSETEMGILSPRGKYVHVYINGQYWGVYDLHERANAEFFADHLGGQPEDYDVLHHPEFVGEDFAVVDGSDSAWLTMQNLARAGINTAAQYQAIREFLDIDAFITAMISRMWSGDFDWCGPIFENNLDRTVFDNKNWYAGRRSREGAAPGDGKFLFFAWDAEMSMGLHLKFNLGLNHPQRELDFDLTRANDSGSPVALYDRLRNYSEFRVRFGDLLQKHLFNEGAMSTANNLARLCAMEAEIENAMIAESARWGDEGGGTGVFDRDGEWRSEVNWLKNGFIAGRNDRLIDQFRDRGLFPSIGAPTFSQRGGAVPAGFQLNMSGSGGTIFYTLDGSDPRLVGGGINPKATIYTGSITLQGPSVIVRARLRASANSWSNLDEATFIIGQAAGAANLAISEFHYHPANPTLPGELAVSPDDRDYEFIELTNTSDATITLTGIEFTQGISFTLDATAPIQELAAGGRILIVANRDAFLARYGQALAGQIAGTFADLSKLSNDGETLTLTDASGQPISSIPYSDSPPWPTAADGYGRSLVLRQPIGSIDASLPSSWRASVLAGGTPGKPEITDYASWIAAFFDPDAPDFDLLSAPQADPDHDGLRNLIEYALARSPQQPEWQSDSPSAILVELFGRNHAALSYRHQPDLADIVLSVESSTDLLNWSSVNIVDFGTPTPQSDGTSVAISRATTPFAPATPTYFRLRIQLLSD